MIPRNSRKEPADRRLQNVFRVRTDKLDFHPRLALVPVLEEIATQVDHHGDPKRKERLERLAGDWSSFVADVGTNGVLDPIKVVRGHKGRYLVCDGRNRVTGARAANVGTVPAILVKREDVDMIVQSTVIGRRHWSKSMKAWLAVLMNPSVVQNGVGQPKKNSDKIGILSRESLASQFGVSADLIDQACEIHKHCYDAKGKQTKTGKVIEPSIWLGASLGGIKSGLGAELAAGGQEGKARKESGLSGVIASLASIKLKTAGFSTWAPEQIALFEDRLPEILAEWDLDFIAVLRRHLEAADEVVIDTPTAKPAKAAKPTKAKPAPMNALIIQGLLQTSVQSLQFAEAVKQATVAEMDVAIGSFNPNQTKLKGKAFEEATYRRTILQGERGAKLKIAEVNARIS